MALSSCNKKNRITLKYFFIVSLAVILFFSIGSGWVVSGSDDCPIPDIFVLLEGIDEGLQDLFLRKIVQENQDEVKFSIPLGEELIANDSRYIMKVSSSSFDDSPRWIEVTLQDPKGRVVFGQNVLTPVNGRDETSINNFLVDQQVAYCSPLLNKVREHQKRIREIENSAIEASIGGLYDFIEVNPGTEISFDFWLRDCDGYYLGNREVSIEFRGVGDVFPGELTTDDAGRGSFTFESEEEGLAEVLIKYLFETPEGKSREALGTNRMVIKVGRNSEFFFQSWFNWKLTRSRSDNVAWVTGNFLAKVPLKEVEGESGVFEGRGKFYLSDVIYSSGEGTFEPMLKDGRMDVIIRTGEKGEPMVEINVKDRPGEYIEISSEGAAWIEYLWFAWAHYFLSEAEGQTTAPNIYWGPFYLYFDWMDDPSRTGKLGYGEYELVCPFHRAHWGIDFQGTLKIYFEVFIE